VYRGPPEVYRGPCMKNMAWNRPITYTRMPHISDVHSKFALRPHHVWKYGRQPMCGR